jgi:hypothetical protein
MKLMNTMVPAPARNTAPPFLNRFLSSLGRSVWAGLILYLFGLNGSPAATTVSGPVSGNWPTNGNPYFVVADLTVAGGQSLAIDPGVEVVLAPGVTFYVSGNLQAIGELGRPILFRGASPDHYWNGLNIAYGGGNSRLSFCRISDATNGLTLRITDVTAALTTEIDNCEFRNCVEACLYGVAEGRVHGNISGWWGTYPSLNPFVHNCRFEDSATGCRFLIFGQDSSTGGCCPPGHVYGLGQASPRLLNNVFQDLTGAALETVTGRDAGSSLPAFVNNTVVNAGSGVVTGNPFDVGMTNNIFQGCGTGVRRSGLILTHKSGIPQTG